MWRWPSAKLEVLGRAARVEVDSDSTIIGGIGSAAAIQERVSMIRKERESTTCEYDRKQLDERLAKLSRGVALVKVGAATESGLKERKLRVEDALHATRPAVEEGLVPGGGVALLRARKALKELALRTLDEDSGVKIVMRALEEPPRRIVLNAADEPSIVLYRKQVAKSPCDRLEFLRRSCPLQLRWTHELSKSRDSAASGRSPSCSLQR